MTILDHDTGMSISSCHIGTDYVRRETIGFSTATRRNQRRIPIAGKKNYVVASEIK